VVRVGDEGQRAPSLEGRLFSVMSTTKLANFVNNGLRPASRFGVAIRRARHQR